MNYLTIMVRQNISKAIDMSSFSWNGSSMVVVVMSIYHFPID